LKQLHVIFLASWYPSRILKTNGDFIQRHAEAVSLVHKVSVIHVIADKNLAKHIEISDKTINGIRTLIAYIRPSTNSFIKWFRFYKAYKLVLKKVANFDIIHVNKFYPAGIFAYLYKKKYQIPYIITEHHSRYQQAYSNKIGFLELYLSKKIVKKASFVCPVSDDLGKSMQKLGLKGNYKKVPNVVDTNRFIVAKTDKKAVFTLLHVSSMVALKNVEGILRVIKKLEQKVAKFEFNIIGGNAEDFIEKAKELHINLDNLVFKNQVSHSQITSYFQKADVFILFSDTENLPCVILESFSCGTPVISTNVGGVSEYFPENYGLLIEVKNEDKLLDAILKVKNNYAVEKPEKMHQYVVENFSKQKIAEEFSKYYFMALDK